MNVHKNIFRYSFIMIFCAISMSSLAQEKKDDKEQKPAAPTPPGGITEEIEVVRPYKPVLADAAKIRRSPDMNFKKTFIPDLDYHVSDQKFDLNTNLYQLQTQPLPQLQETSLTNNFVRVGAGNLNTGLAEIYLNTGQDEALQAGMYFKHLNQEGSLTDQKVSAQQAAIFGRSILDKITLNGELGFDRLGTYFYGVNPADSVANTDPARQRYTTISLNGELLKNYSVTEEQPFTYAVKADAYFLRNYYKAKENSIALSGFINKSWNQFNFGINTSVDLGSTKDSVSIANNIFRFNPYVKFQGPNYKLIVGVNVVNEFGENSRGNLFPAVSVEFPVVPGYATIFGGYRGDAVKTSLRDLSNENPFLASNLTIKNALEKTHIYGGVKGNAGSGFNYKVSIFYKKIEDMPLFGNSLANLSKFDLIYDTGDSKIIGFEGEISINASETFTWTGKVNINNYDMATEAAAWYKPDFRLTSNARLSVNKKLAIEGELVLNGEAEAKTYTRIDDIQQPVEQTVPMKSYVDLSGSAEYRFRKKIGLFLRVNNIFGSEYEKYLYYPRFGLNVFGGFNYSF